MFVHHASLCCSLSLSFCVSVLLHDDDAKNLKINTHEKPEKHGDDQIMTRS